MLFHLYRHIPTPSSFSGAQASKKQKSSGKDFIYDRDIVCLPNSFSSANKVVKIPRGKHSREYLANNGLVGKIRLKSSMTEDEIMREIRSVFATPMMDDSEFRFSILQPSGGGAKSLMVPSRSYSFQWTAAAVAGANKSPIYILSVDSLDVSCVGVRVWWAYIIMCVAFFFMCVCSDLSV